MLLLLLVLLLPVCVCVRHPVSSRSDKRLSRCYHLLVPPAPCWLILETSLFQLVFLPELALCDLTVFPPPPLWSLHPPGRWTWPSPRLAVMADGRQPEQHWTSNGQENGGQNGYLDYDSAYRENGYHGATAATAMTAGQCLCMFECFAGNITNSHWGNLQNYCNNARVKMILLKKKTINKMK